jgi:hypothetical protein
LRDYRGQTVWIYPFQYNPVTKTLRIYDEIVLKISEAENDGPGENILVRSSELKSVEPEFNEIYSNLFLNYSTLRYTAVDETGEMLIITDASFMSALQPLIDWKIRKGIKVTMVSVTTAGGTATAIKNYIANFYSTHPLKYVLLIGDVAQVPTLTAVGGASDPSYSYLVGNDSYPEIFVGRFSAESLADVNTQVQRTIDYERYPQAGNPWYNHGVSIASDQGPGDDNEMDFEHEQVIRAKLLAFTYTSVSELYDGSQGGVDAPGNPSPNDVLSVLNSGASIVNYTGHGSQVSWGTSGFSNSDIANMTNTQMLPFICSVGCVNGDFSSTTCFGEAFLRAQSSGQPVGAVATFMSSINQYWNEPMRAQDEMVDLLVGTYPVNIKRTFGGLCENGCMNMNDVYGTSGADMTDTWHIFGDPSLNVRTAAPTAITATHAATLMVGSSQLSITSNTDGALACLSMNGQILGTGVVAGGSVTITFPSISSIDTIFVTLTAFNKVPYEGTVQVIPGSAPFVIETSNTIVDITGNNNGAADYSENITLDVTLENVGQLIANSVNAVISTADPNVTITDNSNAFGNISASGSSTVNNAFAYTVANNVADQHTVPFTLTITDNASNTWIASVNHVMNAPVLAIGTISLNDVAGNANGQLDPGETGTFIIENLNSGHSATVAATAVLTSTSPYITINTLNTNVGVINPNATATASFSVTMAPNMSVGSNFTLTITTTAGGYSATQTFTITAGDQIEDFETGIFNRYPWVMAGNLPWTTSTTNSYQGTYNARSGAIGDNQASEMNVTENVLIADNISFYRYVSSEADYDFLKFYIDNTLIDSWSGAVPWGYVSYPVTTGLHTFRWVYEKDAYQAGGSDKARVDNINFPYIGNIILTGDQHASPFNAELVVYPNPADELLNIVYNLDKAGFTSLQVYNSLGQEIKSSSRNENGSAGPHQVTVNTSGLDAGIYFVKLTTVNGNAIQKFMVK